MERRYYFGPDKLAFSLLENGRVVTATTLPFHGIISRGLLNYFVQHKLRNEFWYKYAPYLTESDFEPEDQEFKIIKKYVKVAKVLSFGQSAYCVQQYVERYCNDRDIKATKVEIWNIKEGHTSSVWKVTIAFQNEIEIFCVNVARDEAANHELRESSEKMRIIGDKCPKINLAKIYSIDTINDKLLPSNIVITRNEWIPDSYEIHNRKNKNTDETEWLMVDRFLTNKDNPAFISSILGRVFTTQETAKIEKGINDFLTQAATCLTITPKININDGDVVWNGEKAFIVALN
ncbi:MAG: hypothetical protein LCH81_15320 [Bacteroidetes bacterium]|nr:hypothetical protein [Bacteroidota bacterium]